jgi:hypothetical protein
MCVVDKYRPGLLKPVVLDYIYTTSLLKKGLNPAYYSTTTLHQNAFEPESATSF